MKSLREAVRAMLQDDALYTRRDLPGDADDPTDEDECDCGCNSCNHSDEEDDYVTPKYALYSMIGDAINIYDQMDDDEFDDEEMNHMIMEMAAEIRKMKG